LQYIAGLSEAVAKNVVAYRNENGLFESKAQIKKAKGLGPKAYEQAIGFLRIKGGKEPLDATGIHPEIHKQVYAFLETELGVKKKALKLPMAVQKYTDQQIKDRSTKYEIGHETMKDVIMELQRPGLDPRDELEVPCFKSDVLEVKDVKIGMELEGIVRNVTDFGAFVDIGLHNDGLVHKSQLANHYVTNPIEVVSVGQRVKVRVLDIDVEREKISLTMKDGSGTAPVIRPKSVVEESPRPRGGKDDDTVGESNMKGNISFS